MNMTSPARGSVRRTLQSLALNDTLHLVVNTSLVRDLTHLREVHRKLAFGTSMVEDYPSAVVLRDRLEDLVEKRPASRRAAFACLVIIQDDSEVPY